MDKDKLDILTFFLEQIGFLNETNIKTFHSVFYKLSLLMDEHKSNKLSPEESAFITDLNTRLSTYTFPEDFINNEICDYLDAIDYIKPLFQRLLNNEYSTKYNHDDFQRVNNIASILAVSLAMDPTDKIVVRPNDKYIRLCTYHSEKTPSLYLYDNRGSNGIFCRGCGLQQNIFEYLAEYLQITLEESLEIIAKAYGVTIIPNYGTSEIEHELIDKIKEVQVSRRYQDLKLTSETKTKINDAWIDCHGLLFCEHDGLIDLFSVQGYSTQKCIEQDYHRFAVYRGYNNECIAQRTFHKGTNCYDYFEEPGYPINLPNQEKFVNCKLSGGMEFIKMQRLARKAGVITTSLGGLATAEELELILKFARERYQTIKLSSGIPILYKTPNYRL